METLTIGEIKAKYPDEWVLLGNPDIHNTKVLGGVVLFHSKDKKEVCYLGKTLTSGYERITIAYTGTHSTLGRIGIMKRL